MPYVLARYTTKEMRPHKDTPRDRKDSDAKADTQKSAGRQVETQKECPEEAIHEIPSTVGTHA